MTNRVTLSRANRLVCLVGAILLMSFAVKSQGTATQSATVDNSNIRPPITKADLQIVKRASAILDSPSKWNRSETQECPAGAEAIETANVATNQQDKAWRALTQAEKLQRLKEVLLANNGTLHPAQNSSAYRGEQFKE